MKIPYKITEVINIKINEDKKIIETSKENYETSNIGEGKNIVIDGLKMKTIVSIGGEVLSMIGMGYFFIVWREA